VDRCRVVAEDIEKRMPGPDEAATDRRLRAEVDNLRAARDLATADVRVAITVAVNQVVTWRDLREIWAWAAELADDPALATHPDRVAVLAGAAEAARLVGDFATAERRAHETVAAADPDTQLDALSRAWSVLAVVAHFRGDFAAARDAWLRAQDGAGAEASAFVGSAALAAAYGGDPENARRLLDRSRSLAVCGSHDAFVAYVEGELRATTHPEESVPYYVEAIAEACRVGCNFVEGVARVSLASVRARIGDVSGAAEGFGYLIDFWRRTGQTTQLWTTARNAAEVLAAAGRSRTAALLVCRRGRGDCPVQRPLLHAGRVAGGGRGAARAPRRGGPARPCGGSRPCRGRAGEACLRRAAHPTRLGLPGDRPADSCPAGSRPDGCPDGC
jgi:hypothetical protein